MAPGSGRRQTDLTEGPQQNRYKPALEDNFAVQAPNAKSIPWPAKPTHYGKCEIH